MNNVEILKRGYQYFADGNVPAVLEMFHPEIKWDECQGFPFVDGDGIFIGPEDIVKHVFSQLPAHYDNFNIEIDELFGSGDRVVMMGHYTGTWKASGKPFRANATHVWSVKDGKAISFFQAVDTASIITS